MSTKTIPDIPPDNTDNEIHIYFQPNETGSQTYPFVEIENAQGRSINIGSWRMDASGYYVLRITASDILRHPDAKPLAPSKPTSTH